MTTDAVANNKPSGDAQRGLHVGRSLTGAGLEATGGGHTLTGRRAGEPPRGEEAKEWLLSLVDVTPQHGGESLVRDLQRAAPGSLGPYNHRALSNQ